MKQNLVVLLADFFNLFEIHPTKCVCYPGMEQPSGNDFQSIFRSKFLVNEAINLFIYDCIMKSNSGDGLIVIFFL